MIQYISAEANILNCCSVFILRFSLNQTTTTTTAASVSHRIIIIMYVVSKIERENISILKCGYEIDVPFPQNSIWHVYTLGSIISNLSINHTHILMWSNIIIFILLHRILLNGPYRLSKCLILIRFNMKMGPIRIWTTPKNWIDTTNKTQQRCQQQQEQQSGLLIFIMSMSRHK